MRHSMVISAAEPSDGRVIVSTCREDDGVQLRPEPFFLFVPAENLQSLLMFRTGLNAPQTYTGARNRFTMSPSEEPEISSVFRPAVTEENSIFLHTS